MICFTNDHVCVPPVVGTSRPYPHSWLCNWSNTMGVTSGAGFTYLSGAQELTSGCGGVHVAWPLVFCVMFWRSLFVLLSYGHCVVCPSSIYGFWLPLWYLQTLLTQIPLSVLVNTKRTSSPSHQYVTCWYNWQITHLALNDNHSLKSNRFCKFNM